MTKKTANIYRVLFNEPPAGYDGKREFLFTSLSAIYEVFTPSEIGCKVENLWAVGVSDGNAYRNKLVTISLDVMYSKANKNPKRGGGAAG